MADGYIIYRVNNSQAGIDIVMASGQTLPPLRFFDANNNLIGSFTTNGGFSSAQFNIQGTDPNTSPVNIMAAPNTSPGIPTLDLITHEDVNGNPVTIIQFLTEGTIQWFGLTTGGIANMCQILADWADANVATRHSELIFKTHGTGGYIEALRLGTTAAGSPTIGALGAPDVVRQPTASTAGIAAIRTDTLANAVADIKVILTALRAWAVTEGFTNNTA